MIKAVLYDLDGLIVDSEPLHGVASERALNEFGRTLAQIPEAVRKGFYGKRVIDVSAEIVESLRLPVSPEEWSERRQAIFMGLIGKGISLMPGLEDSLVFFSSRGLARAVVSSGDRRYVNRILEVTGIAGRFDTVVTGGDVSRGKPDPQCYLLGASRLNVAPGACLVLEDAYAGICAARAAGMKTIGIRNLFNDRFDGADLVLDSLAEIDDRVLAALSGDGPEMPVQGPGALR